jgi:hypothetical protein
VCGCDRGEHDLAHRPDDDGQREERERVGPRDEPEPDSGQRDSERHDRPRWKPACPSHERELEQDDERAVQRHQETVVHAREPGLADLEREVPERDQRDEDRGPEKQEERSVGGERSPEAAFGLFVARRAAAFRKGDERDDPGHDRRRGVGGEHPDERALGDDPADRRADAVAQVDREPIEREAWDAVTGGDEVAERPLAAGR